MERKNIAGMSMKGGRRDNFFFCLLEFFPDSDRWFLHSLLKVKDADGIGGDEAIRKWIDTYHLKKLVIDIPLTSPPCQNCELDCPGASKCPQQDVKKVRNEMTAFLAKDLEIQKGHPKTYERDRNKANEVDYSRDIFAKETSHHILSKSFKRRLKKGFLPYWNRPLDYWIWLKYYDQLLDLFNISYDSFGNTSLMLQSRFSYLKRHFPSELTLYEGNIYITLIELVRSKVLRKKDIIDMGDLELGVEARLDILKKIEKKLSIFIYDQDLETLVTQPRAFESFLLAVSGQRVSLNSTWDIPTWCSPDKNRFVSPDFKE